MVEVLKVLRNPRRENFPFEVASAQAALEQIASRDKVVYKQILEEAYEREELAPEDKRGSRIYLTILLLQIAHKRGFIVFE